MSLLLLFATPQTASSDTDSAALTEAAAIVAALTATEAATQTETASLTATPAATDSTSETDSATVSAAPSTAESATLTDSTAIAIGGVSDSGAATDSATVSAASSTTDSASSTDVASVAASPSTTDTATETDSASIAAAASTSDAGTVTDSVSLSTASSSTDSATQTESASIASASHTTDTSTESETAALSAVASDVDAASLTDSGSLAAANSATDNGTASESGAIAASVSTTDAATLTESASTSDAESGTDSATASDAASIAAIISSTEAPGLTDTAALTAAPVATDSAATDDSASLTATVTTTDAANSVCTDYGAAVYGQDSFGCTGVVAVLSESASLAIGGVSDTSAVDDAPTIALDIGTSDTAALTETERAQDASNPTDSDSGAATEATDIVASVTTADATALVSESASLAVGGVSDTAAVTEDAVAVQITTQTASDTDTVAFTESAEVVLSKPPKAGGKGSRPRPLLTRFKREQEPRLVTGRLLASSPRLGGRGQAGSAPRTISGWLDGPQPRLRSIGYAVNLRHTVARVSSPKPLLHGRGRFLERIRVRADLRGFGPVLQAKATNTPDEAWLLAVLLADSRDAMRAWDTEATKRLSNLQRESNAQVARTDRQQHRLVQAALPHLRHAFSAQRDAILVALPHASKASVDPDYVLNDQGFLNAVALLIQAIEDTQRAGVTLGYTDAAPPDAFDLSSPYIDAAITQLATRVAGITDTTAQAIRDVIAQGLSEGWSVAEMGDAIQQLGAFSDTRALTIAATESRMALSLGTIAAGQDLGVTHYLIADGDYDEACAEVDGTVQTAEWFMDNVLQHPNCRRVGTPLPADAAVPA